MNTSTSMPAGNRVPIGKFLEESNPTATSQVFVADLTHPNKGTWAALAGTGDVVGTPPTVTRSLAVFTDTTGLLITDIANGPILLSTGVMIIDPNDLSKAIGFGSAGNEYIYVASGVMHIVTTSKLVIDQSPTIGVGAAGVDYAITVDGETNDGVLTWMEDEDYFKYSDDVLMNSTERLYLLDTTSYLYATSAGNATLAAATLLTLGVAGDTTLGDSTLRYVYPQTNGKIGLYDSGETKGFAGIRFAGEAAVKCSMLRTGTAASSGNTLTVQAGSCVSGGSNKNGGDLVLAPGASTGTGLGATRIQGLGRNAGTTTDNALVDRLVLPATVLLSDVATDLFDVTVAASQAAGGMVVWSIEAIDASNTQCLAGITTFAVVRSSGGTFQTNITNDTTNDAKAVSSGTLTTSWSINTSGSTATIRVTPTGSLTETTYRITFTIFNMSQLAITQK